MERHILVCCKNVLNSKVVQYSTYMKFDHNHPPTWLYMASAETNDLAKNKQIIVVSTYMI